MEYIIVITVILAIAIAKIIQNYFSNVYNYWKNRGVNGPVPLPIFGNFIPMLIKPTNEIEVQRRFKYGRVYGSFEFSKPVLTIGEPDLIREVTIKQFHIFRNRYNRFLNDSFLENTMFFSTDETWKRLRSYLSPVFTSKKMKTMFRSVEKCSENTLQFINSIGDKEIVLKITMLSFTMDVIAKCVFGVNTNGYKDPNNEFLLRAHKLANINIWRVLSTLIVPKRIQELHKSLEFTLADQETMNYFKKVLFEIIAERKNNKIQNNDFVNLMLSLEEIEDEEDLNNILFDCSETNELNEKERDVSVKEKKKLTNEEIIAQALMFFVAGYETTSTLLNFTLHTLAVNPNIQKKLYEEIVQYFGNKDGLDYDTIQLMPYLDAVVNESLRMYPPLVVLDRIASEDYLLGDQKLKIEKGTVINLPFYSIHHDPEFYPEPHLFKPERFLPENKHLIKPYTFIPFGSGPRHCIGMRFALMTAKTFLVKLLNNYKVIKTKNTAPKPKFTIIFGLLTSEPLIVAFTPRHS